MKKSIHLVSFDIPYPPNYGGIIDVFYKIKELHALGVKIHLHTYIFNDKKPQVALEQYCEKIYYYTRKNTFLSLCSLVPFRIQSRSSRKLIANLKNLEIPIIFEGLHTTYPLSVFNFKNTYVRTHNIEHAYFFGLAKSEKKIFKKLFFFIEALKLRRFEKVLQKATGIFSISPYEQIYFSENYGSKASYIPVFHHAPIIKIKQEIGTFILYHGDLRVADNIRAALFLIEVYKETTFKFVIASSCKNAAVMHQIKKYNNILFTEIPDQKSLEILFEKAQINALVTFQETGIKLKLLNTLYQGKHIIANSKMIDNTGLEHLCETANTKKEILAKTIVLMQQTFSNQQGLERQAQLLSFSPVENAKKIIHLIFK